MWSFSFSLKVYRSTKITRRFQFLVSDLLTSSVSWGIQTETRYDVCKEKFGPREKTEITIGLSVGFY